MKSRLAILAVVGLMALTSCSASVSEDPTGAVNVVDGEPKEVVTPPEPQISPAPELSAAFSSPWPSGGFSRRELADAALARAYQFFEQRSVGASADLLVIESQDTVLEFHQVLNRDIAQVTVDSFANYLPSGAFLVLGTDLNFFEESVKARDRRFDSRAIPSGGDVCVAYFGSAWISLPDMFRAERLPEDQNYTACVAHELFHVAQDSLDKWPAGQIHPPGHRYYRPYWLTEGSAHFMGNAMVSYLGYHPYWGNHFTLGESELQQERPRLRGYETAESDFAGYQWGQLATEYIVASVGVEPLMDIWKHVGEGAPFEEAFSQALGLTVEEFYEAFDTMNDAMLEG